MTRFLIFLLLLAGGLSGCLDHRIPSITPGLPVSRLRVKKMILELPDNVAKVSLFNYDTKGRLNSILIYQTPDSTISELDYNYYRYDEQDRLTGYRREVVLYPRGNRENAIDTYSFGYDETDKLNQMAHLNGFFVGFTYGSNNQLTRANKSFGVPGLAIREVDSFTSTGNNLTGFQYDVSITAMGGLPFGGPGNTNTYTHDDKLNPFYGVFLIPAPYPKGFVYLLNNYAQAITYFGGTDNVLNLSQNNVLTETSLNSKTTYQYQYNAANLPTVRVKTTTATKPFESVSVETLRFEYESY
jgi:hypothetical protein